MNHFLKDLGKDFFNLGLNTDEYVVQDLLST